MFLTRTYCLVYILLSSLTNGLCSSGLRSLKPLNKSFLNTRDEHAKFCIAADDQYKFLATSYNDYVCMPTESMHGDQTLKLQRVKIHHPVPGPQLANEMVRNDCGPIRDNPTICWLVPRSRWVHQTWHDNGKVYGFCQTISRWVSMTDEKWQILAPFEQFSKALLDDIFMDIVRKECGRWLKAGPDIVNKAVSGFVRQSADEIYIPIELYDELVKFTLPDLIYLKERDLYSGNSNWCPVL
eukprot:280344_1